MARPGPQAQAGVNISEAHDELGVHSTSSNIRAANRWDHFLARWGVRRNRHRVGPGLYALGTPGPEARVFVTANYTLSFDALRSALVGLDAYILVLDTRGINVWCAAGKGTFGTHELVSRIEATRLREIVSHRRLILPQLGAPGVAAHEVKRRAGFTVRYGPVRAVDIPEYLRSGRASAEMRRVRFSILDRSVLIPVELVHVLLPMVLSAALLYLLGGLLTAGAAVAAVLAGAVLFPVLLPWIPSKDFSSKGFILGLLVALAFGAAALFLPQEAALWLRLARAGGFLLAMPPVTACLALNFTGSTPFASKSGVRREMSVYIRHMAWTFGLGLVLTIIAGLVPMLLR